MFCEERPDGAADCALCPHNCAIPENSAGLCGVRENINRKLFAAGYGRISSAALDPVEKKPLRMFKPGMRVLSIGGFGCNFRCPFCQNCAISIEYDKKSLLESEILSPRDAAGLAVKTVRDGNIGLAYTYNEPFTGYEFVYDCAKLIREAGLCNIIVTNGYINKAPLEKLLPLTDAMNIDLKSFSEKFYGKIGGSLEPVKHTIAAAAESGCHVEITNLIIPGENDSEEEITKIAEWLTLVNPKIPLHLTRFFPRYKYSGRPQAPQELIDRLGAVAKRRLENVFV
jgi:pyruvate formate lyase activating enzyme